MAYMPSGNTMLQRQQGFLARAFLGACRSAVDDASGTGWRPQSQVADRHLKFRETRDNLRGRTLTHIPGSLALPTGLADTSEAAPRTAEAGGCVRRQ